MKPSNITYCTGCVLLLFLVTLSQAQTPSYLEKGGDLSMAKPRPPVILSPDEREEFRDKFKITFMWNWARDAAAYHIVLSRDREFKNIAYENAKVTANSHEIGNLGYGTYFFKVSSVSSDGSEGPFSDTRTFIIVPPPPAKVR